MMTQTAIRDCYFDYTLSQTNVAVALSDLRAALPRIPASELDAALTRMMELPGVILYPEDNPQARTAELETGALRLADGWAVKHWMKLER